MGAVRHQGFIPWDDDIDIMVDRSNYNKIIAFFDSLGDRTKYILIRYLWIDRIQQKDDHREGLYANTIDVFVTDNCPNNVVARKLKIFLIKMLQGMMKEDHDIGSQSSFYKACLLITRIMGKPFSEKNLNGTKALLKLEIIRKRIIYRDIQIYLNCFHLDIAGNYLIQS